MTSKEFSELPIRDVQIYFSAFYSALDDAGIVSPESRSLVCLLLSLGANGKDGVSITNEDLSREMGVSLKTMIRHRHQLMSEQKKSKVFIVTYESGRWENGVPIPSRYRLHWDVLKAYIAKRLKQKHGAPVGV